MSSVRFANAESAKACVGVCRFKSSALVLAENGSQLMNGRWFDERQLEAYIADGSEKFKRSDEKKVELDDTNTGAGDVAAGEGERLDKFGEWLEEEETKKNSSKKEGKQEL